MPISDFSTIGGRPVYHGSVGCQASMALYGGAPIAPFYGIASIAIVHDPSLNRKAIPMPRHRDKFGDAIPVAGDDS